MPRKKLKKNVSSRPRLRARAEQRIRETRPDIARMTPKEVQRLVHELEVHQIELELQNEELRNAQVELAESRDRYSALYEFAPVGYVTLDKHGRILESNLAASTMLGVERRSLQRSSFSKSVFRDSQDDWHRFRQAAFSSEAKQTCEIWMRKTDGTLLAASLQSVAFGAEDDRGLRVAFIDITRRKEAEQALRELSQTLERRVEEQTAQTRLQAEAIANLSEGVVITSGSDWLSSRIVFVNEAMSRITGYRASELVGQRPTLLHGSLTDREVLRHLCAGLSAGKSCKAELIHYRKDRTPYNVEISIAPLRDAEGRLTNFVSIRREITERKQAEQMLRESESRFRMMADHAPVMIWVSGDDRQCTWLNKPWLDFTGRPMEQQLGSGWTQGLHPDDSERCMEIYRRAFDARQAFTVEYRYRRHDGQWRWLVDYGIPLYHESGAFEGYIGSCIDVTDRRQAEEGIRESEARIHAVLNTAADAIITIDRRGIIISVNPATERMFRYRQNELVGQNVKILMPSPYHEEHDSYIARYLETGEARIIGYGREVMGRRKDGSTFPVDLAVSEIEDLGLFTGIIRDISVRKQTEQELDHYRKDLRAMSSELMLAEERERQQLAQDLHDGLGQAIFLARRKLDQASIEEVGSILDGVARTVNSLTFELSPPVLRQLGFRSALRWLARDMQQRYGLSVQVVNGKGPTLSFDESVAVVLFRSVRELLINVARHAGTNSATIKVRKLGSNAVISVEDRGKGFDVAKQFRPAYAGRFGLFSIHERLEYLGGSVEIESAPGKGTKVTLTAPLTIGNPATTTD